MMTTLKVGIIGSGFMGKMYAAIFYELLQTELAAVTDANQSHFVATHLEGIEIYFLIPVLAPTYGGTHAP
jgi:predicted dehydrogenase